MGSRLLLLQRGNTLSGLEDPSLHPSPPSKKCGSLRKSMMTLAPPLSTESAHKLEPRVPLLTFYISPFDSVPRSALSRSSFSSLVDCFEFELLSFEYEDNCFV